MSDEKIHHPFSPSTLANLEVCPCFGSQQAVTPHERTIAGTRAHNVVESGRDDARLDDKDAVAAADCIDFVDRRRQLMEENRLREVARVCDALAREFDDHPDSCAFEAESNVPKIIELKEVYLAVDDKEFEEMVQVGTARTRSIVKSTTAGWVDRVLINHDRTYAEIVDYKFGYWRVAEAKDNPQGIAYLLGIFREYPTVDSVRVFFKQPHLDLLSEALFTRDQIPALYLRIQTIVARARAARAQINLGDWSSAKPHVPVCNFCKNLGRCEKVLDFACKVGNKFYPLQIPENITPTLVNDPHQTSLAMRLSQVLAIWAGAFRAQVTDRVLRQEAAMPEGFVLQSKSNREVAIPAEFKKVVLRYLSEQEYADIAPVPGFGVVEDLVKERAPRGSKKAAIENLQRELEDSGAVVKGESYSFLRAVSKE
jgi:hypothetical protein